MVGVHIHQVIKFICTKLQDKEQVIKALPSTKFNSFGHQKFCISTKWGFTKFEEDEFEDKVATCLVPDSYGVKRRSQLGSPGQEAGPDFPRSFTMLSYTQIMFSNKSDIQSGEKQQQQQQNHFIPLCNVL